MVKYADDEFVPGAAFYETLKKTCTVVSMFKSQFGIQDGNSKDPKVSQPTGGGMFGGIISNMTTFGKTNSNPQNQEEKKNMQKF